MINKRALKYITEASEKKRIQKCKINLEISKKNLMSCKKVKNLERKASTSFHFLKTEKKENGKKAI